MSNHHRQMIIILGIVLLGFIGNSMAYPILAPLFLHDTQSHFATAALSTHARALWLGITLSMYPLGQFFGSPFLGALSDQHGRKKILIFSSLLMMLGYLLSGIALTTAKLGLMILSRFLTGFFEGNISIARSIAVDLKEINKQKALGGISAMTSLGYVIGPIFGGVLADNTLVGWFSYALPFYVSAGVSLLLVLFCSAFLRETLQQHNHSNLAWYTQLNVIKRFHRLKHNQYLMWLFLLACLFTLGTDAFYDFSPAYLTHYYHMTTVSIALYVTIISVALMISCGWLAVKLNQYFSHIRAIVLSMPIVWFCYLSLLFTPAHWGVASLFAIAGLGIGVVSNNFSVMVSDAAEANIQGEAFGTLWALRMLGDAIICIAGGFLLALSTLLPFVLSSGITLIAWFMLIKFKKQQKEQKEQAL